MNWDTLWQFVRYAIISIGSVVSGVNYTVGDPNVALIAAGAAILTAAWGLWVKLRTVPVLESVVKSANIPSVSPVTGGKVPRPEPVVIPPAPPPPPPSPPKRRR